MAIDDDGKGQGPNGDPKEPDREFNFPAQDIYTTWALGAGRNDFFPSTEQQDWIPVLLRLKGISSVAFANGRTEEDPSEEVNQDLLGAEVEDPWLSVVQVSRLFIRSDQGKLDPLFLVALVRPRFFNLLELEANTNLRDVVSAVTIGTPLDFSPTSLFLIPENPEDSDLEALEWPDLSNNEPSDGMVIVAVIDDGIPFGHARFWKADRDTRIEYVWLQDKEFNDGSGLQGRELTRSGINDALKEATRGGVVDEDVFYREAGAIDYRSDTHKSIARQVSHGSHIMDAATGYDYLEPAERALAEKRPIICVQLPTDSTADTSGGSLEPYLAAAVQYILHRADKIAEARNSGPIPVVINFSYGHHIGAHDGSHDAVAFIEQAIAERMATHGVPLRVVLPSGNSHLTRTHARVDFQKRDDVELSWQVQPDDKTWTFMEIWLPLGSVSSSRLSVTLTPPGGGTPISLNENSPSRVTFPASPPAPMNDIVYFIQYGQHPVTGRGRFIIGLQPTERLWPQEKVDPNDPDQPTAPSGRWKVTLTKETTADLVVHAWIWRDDTPLGFPIHGRQSYFDQECYRRYDDYGRPIEEDDPDCEIKRAGTINSLATSDAGMIVVGGYYRSEERPAEYSAGGPTLGTRVGPDVMTVSDDSTVHRGQLAAGTRSGSVAALNGTSVAAPQITRWIANNIVGNTLPGRAELLTLMPKVPLGTPERTGTGGVDQNLIDGIPVVDLPRLIVP